jgi:hypothetical protein
LPPSQVKTLNSSDWEAVGFWGCFILGGVALGQR